MKQYTVTFKAELDLGSLGAPDEAIQEAAQAIKLGIAVDPNTPVSKVEVKNKIIFIDVSMTMEASNAQEAIAKVQAYLVAQTNTPEPTPWKTYGFQAKKLA